MPLEACKELADVFWSAQIGDGISDGVLVAELQQWRELFQSQLLHTQRHVVLENKIQEGLLIAPGVLFGESALPQLLGAGEGFGLPLLARFPVNGVDALAVACVGEAQLELGGVFLGLANPR